ncbi:MAG: sugar phosphate isomerase/epimerase family protein [Acidobacteriota bacterium]
MITRRKFLINASAGLSALAASQFSLALGATQAKDPTRFQIACMTLPYANFPLQRALEGIAVAGYRYVAWGTRHVEASGERVPVLEIDAQPAEAKKLGDRCRDLGLAPVMMFSGIYVAADGAVDAHKKRIEQAAAAGISQVLTFGHTEGGKLPIWIENLKELGPFARAAGVTVVIKQHGGETGTGETTARIVRQVDDEGVGLNYDAGNVMDYLNVDPIPDILKCVNEVRSFCIKDHRNYPEDQDCGPGFGEIDHYRLLAPVAFTGLTMPLACENIFAPLLPRPSAPEGVDALARRAREYLEVVIEGLQEEQGA